MTTYHLPLSQNNGWTITKSTAHKHQYGVRDTKPV
jgi:hypothetical protein